MSLLLGLLAAASIQTAATRPTDEPTPPQPIVIGTSHRLNSSVLGARRTINVVLPAGYPNTPSMRYPVLYVIDGGVDQDLLAISSVALNNAMWGRSADAIVVGIETKDRRNELTGPTADGELLNKYPTAGGSAKFRSFLRDDVKPMVERTYRTNGRNAVVGESLAGLFIVETYMEEPALFDAYGAIDPSLWWDKEALSRMAAAKIGRKQAGRPLYVAIAKEQADEPSAVRRILARVPAGPEQLCFDPRPDLTHATIYQQLAPQLLQFLLPAAEPPSPEFGFEVACSPKF